MFPAVADELETVAAGGGSPGFRTGFPKFSMVSPSGSEIKAKRHQQDQRFDELQTDQGGDQIAADIACRRLREVLHEAVAGIDQQQQDKYREKAQQDLANQIASEDQETVTC